LRRDAQVRSLFALTTRSALTAIAVAAALFAGFSGFIAGHFGRPGVHRCRSRNRHLICRVVALCKAQLGLSTFGASVTRLTVRTWATTIAATPSSTAFAGLTWLAVLTVVDTVRAFSALGSRTTVRAYLLAGRVL
jgi:hypothetical protein